MPSFLGLPYGGNVSVESERVTTGGDTLSLKSQIVETQAQRWRVRIRFKGTKGNEGAAIAAHRNRLGKRRTFALPMPQPLGVTPPTAPLTATGAAGASRLTLSASEDIEAGVFFTLAGSAKVYQIYAKRTGTAALEITPPLLEAVTSAAMDFSPDLTCRYSLDGDMVMRYSSGQVSRPVIEVTEAL